MARKAKWKPLELLLPNKIVNKKDKRKNRKTYPSPRGIAEFTATIKDLKATGLVVAITALFSFAIGYMKKMNGSYRKMVSSGDFNISCYTKCDLLA